MELALDFPQCLYTTHIPYNSPNNKSQLVFLYKLLIIQLIASLETLGLWKPGNFVLYFLLFVFEIVFFRQNLPSKLMNSHVLCEFQYAIYRSSRAKAVRPELNHFLIVFHGNAKKVLNVGLALKVSFIFLILTKHKEPQVQDNYAGSWSVLNHMTKTNLRNCTKCHSVPGQIL